MSGSRNCWNTAFFAPALFHRSRFANFAISRATVRASSSTAPPRETGRKLLESANIKLGIVARDILGASGRAMLRALMAGEADGAVLAELAKGALRRKRGRLAEALTGRFTSHHAVLLGELLAHIEYLECAIARLNDRVEAALRPYADHVTRLQTIPGVGREAAETIIAEIDVDMSRFPSAAHLASWAGVCPGITRALASGRPVRPARATGGSSRCLWNAAGEPAAPSVRISALNMRAWGGGAVRRRLRSPWADGQQCTTELEQSRPARSEFFPQTVPDQHGGVGTVATNGPTATVLVLRYTRRAWPVSAEAT